MALPRVEVVCFSVKLYDNARSVAHEVRHVLAHGYLSAE
jgi:hypothetical protein